jgi:hypothetical protein
LYQSRCGSILFRVWDSQDERYPPLFEAKVFLALDKRRRMPIENAVVYSNRDGDYKMEFAALPQPANPNGYYYLVIQKNGFDFIIAPVAFGAKARFTKNTAVLKPLDK